MKYAAIADWATDKQYSVTFMCAQLGVVRQVLQSRFHCEFPAIRNE